MGAKKILLESRNTWESRCLSWPEIHPTKATVNSIGEAFALLITQNGLLHLNQDLLFIPAKYVPIGKLIQQQGSSLVIRRIFDPMDVLTAQLLHQRLYLLQRFTHKDRL